MVSYLEALKVPQAEIEVGNSQIVTSVGRASFDRHLFLGKLALRIRREPTLVRQYLITAGVTESDLDQMSGQQQVEALFRLIDLNRLRWVLPFLTPRPGGDSDDQADEYSYDYSDRVWALWIHAIASRYGWSRAEIMAMQPEEVAMYVQEISLSEFDEYDQIRLQHEINYRRINPNDKKDFRTRFVPLVRPAWMLPISTAESRRNEAIIVPDAVKPIGFIIDHNNFSQIQEAAS